MSHERHPGHVPAAFPTTGWTLIRAVQDRENAEHEPALERFARLYWNAVFCFLRVRGCPAAEAEDLTQEFFLSLLQGDWIQKADPQRGRFRTFLRMHLGSFLADQTSPRRIRRQKLFERRVLSLETLAGTTDRSYDPPAGETPDQAFDRAFARSVVQVVRQELRKLSEIEKRSEWYAIFEAAYPEDIGTPPMTQQALAEHFGKTRDVIRGVLERMKKRCQRLLRNELRDHGGSETDVETEAAELLTMLGQ